MARGAPALLTCENRAHVWTERHVEEAQQVAHWDRQPPGVPHDRADRLLDLYASGERRAYGPPSLHERVAVADDAFARGDFSLRIDPLEPADEGTYSCHLHHHYCGLHERRIFHLRVSEPSAEPPPRASPGNGSGHGAGPGPGVCLPLHALRGARAFRMALTPRVALQTPRWRAAAASSTSSSPRAAPISSSSWATCWPPCCSSFCCWSPPSWLPSAAAEVRPRQGWGESGPPLPPSTRVSPPQATRTWTGSRESGRGERTHRPAPSSPARAL